MGKVGTPGTTVMYQGIFDMDGLYAAIIDWAKNYGYMWHETTYKHKVPSPDGAVQEFAWTLQKKVNPYIEYAMKMKVKAWELKEVVIDVKGKKKILTSGRIKIALTGDVIFDWQKKFGGSKVALKLGEWYRNYIHNKEVESVHWDTVTYRKWDLQALMKKFFDLQSKKHAYEGYLGDK